MAKARGQIKAEAEKAISKFGKEKIVYMRSAFSDYYECEQVHDFCLEQNSKSRCETPIKLGKILEMLEEEKQRERILSKLG